jgi:hypothetical protein
LATFSIQGGWEVGSGAVHAGLILKKERAPAG